MDKITDGYFLDKGALECCRKNIKCDLTSYIEKCKECSREYKAVKYGSIKDNKIHIKWVYEWIKKQ